MPSFVILILVIAFLTFIYFLLEEEPKKEEVKPGETPASSSSTSKRKPVRHYYLVMMKRENVPEHVRMANAEYFFYRDGTSEMRVRISPKQDNQVTYQVYVNDELMGETSFQDDRQKFYRTWGAEDGQVMKSWDKVSIRRNGVTFCERPLKLNPRLPED